MPRVLIITPTYNERENLPELTAGIFAELPEANLLVVDDASPDGTGDVADAMASTDSRVHVMHRAGKQGLGTAYLAGFAWRSSTATTTSCKWTPTFRMTRYTCGP
jgi:glycosyltransferase involved in cell wall biosynthesis